MLVRIDDFSEFLQLDEDARSRGLDEAARTAEMAQGMTHEKDYRALAATVLKYQPRRIFEIGTFLGVTSDFFLKLLPEATVVSIAYQNPRWKFWLNHSNNSELPREQVGSKVAPERRDRFTQMYGDSHKLTAGKMLSEFGPFDLVLVDGDHSRDGVLQDTKLAKQIINQGGTICWHDANPKEKYMDVRRYLEQELDLHAIATRDDFLGGIASWNADIQARLDNSKEAATG